MKRWVLYINTLLLLAVVGFLFGFTNHKNKQHKLTQIEVVFKENKPTFLTTSMVNKLLIQSEVNLLNKVKSEINLYKIEHEVNKNKMIENVEVFYTPKGKLKAQITQRVPIARIKNVSKSYYLDRQGLVMPLSPNNSARVPLVTGVNTKETEAECFKLVQKITEDDFYKKQIIGIHRKNDGDYLLSTRIGIHKILFGKLNRIDGKLKKLKIFYKKEWESESLKKYRLINLKYNRQVVCSR